MTAPRMWLFRAWQEPNKTLSLGAERRGGAVLGRVHFAAKTGQGNFDFAKILLVGRLFQLEDLSEVDPDEVPAA